MHQVSAINNSCSALERFLFSDMVALLNTIAIVYVSKAACVILLRINCSSTIPRPYLIRTFSITWPKVSTLCNCNILFIQTYIIQDFTLLFIFTFEQSAALSANLGWTEFPKVGGDLKPIALVARLVASSKISPRFAVGFLKAFCSSFKWLPAYWIPVSDMNRRKMSFVPSKIRNMRRSRITRSKPASDMKPIPPKICIASSQTVHADSDAKHCITKRIYNA